MNKKEELEYHKRLNTLVAIKNSIVLICFTILAIVFNQWWIVLISILFMSWIGED